MAIADVAANLRLNISDFSSKLSSASRQMGRFAKTMNKQYGDASRALTRHNFDLKDTARIVQGILVAQTFYTGARAIREATGALWDFNKSLDYAHVTYSALFGDANLASNFMSVLQEHSIETIFDYQNLADASKKLLAYGIEYENLMFIMEGLTNLGAMSGDTAALDRISLALGQIYTRGKLTAEEMRQLANAYVPISDIIQEKFNLSPDDMGRVGDLNLPAGEVINAIVDYANERFASVGDAAMYTITGLQNKIVDTLKVMGVEMLAPVTTVYKSFLAYIADGLEVIRNEFAAGGIGGVFEYLVPDQNTQQMIRQFVANVVNLFKSLVSVGVVAGKVFGNFAHVLVSAFNIVSPVIVAFTNALAAALNGLLNTSNGAALLRIALLGAAAAFVIMRVHAIGALVVTTVTKAVMGLSKALIILSTLITKHPIIALLTGLAVALVGVATTSGNANSGLNKLFDTISGAGGGMSSGDVFQKVEKEIEDSTGAVDEFNQRFEEGTGAAEDMAGAIDKVGGAADKAKKKAGLLSFDEVFKLNEPTDTSTGATGDGIGDDIADIIEGLDSLNDALIPEVPDFSEYIDDFTGSLFGGLEEGILDKLKDSGIGALLGGGIGTIIGSFLGNPVLGAKIGAFAGGLVGWIWDDIQEAIGVSDTQGVTTALTGMIASMIGGVIGGPAGAAIGAAIGTLASGLTSMLWNKLAEVFGRSQGSAEAASVGSTIGLALGGVIGAIIGGPAGAAIGAAIGVLAGGVVGMFWDEIKAAFIRYKDTVASASLGAGIGAVLGYVVGGPGGAVLGAGIGALAKNLIDELWLKIGEMANSDEGDIKRASTASTIGTGIGAVIGMVIGGPGGAAIGAAIGALAGGLGGLFWDKIVEVLSNPNVAIGASVGAAVGAFFGPVGAIIGAVVGGVIGHFWEDIAAGFSKWWADISEGFSGWWSQLTTDWNNWCDNIHTKLSSWWDGVKTNWKTKWDGITTGLTTWLDNTKTRWVDRYDNIKDHLSTWWDDVKTTYSNAQDRVSERLSTWVDNTKEMWTSRYELLKSTLDAWWTGIKSIFSLGQALVTGDLRGWLDKTSTEWSDKYANIRSALDTWWTNLNERFGINFGQMISTTTAKLIRVKTEWSNKWSEIKTNFHKWWKNLKTDMGNWLDDYIWKPISNFFNIEKFWNRIKGLLDGIKQRLSNWWSNVTSIFSDDKGVKGNSGNSSKGANKLLGHATGGVFNREHIARFAEGNRAEAIIPLENGSAMQPFVDAVSNGLLGSLAPVIAQNNSNNFNTLPPMYVGTLIADERGIKELYKKFEVIKVQEDARKGYA